MRLVAVVIVALGLLVPAVGVAGSAPMPTRTVPCGERILTVKFPHVGSRDVDYRYRTVLGAISVPPAYAPRMVFLKGESWPYWTKAGLVVRANVSAVTVRVPRAWRSRLAIIWGNGGQGPFSAVRLAGCGSDPTSGDAYAGGFLLRAKAACVPLQVTVGARSTIVHFGLGRRCR
jgi:hypothetical protein